MAARAALRTLALCCGLLSGGCALPPAVAPSAPPVEYPQATRERMLRVLRAEWQEWGGVVIDAGHDGPAPVAEYDRDGYSRVLAYWSVFAGTRTGNEDRYIGQNQTLAAARDFGPRNTDASGRSPPGEAEAYCGRFFSGDSNAWIWGCQPWSAAFISFVMVSAGINQADFDRNVTHSAYVDQMIRRFQSVGALATFIPREIADYTPRVGDLVCATRGGARLDTWGERWADIQAGRAAPRPMHCDIVSEVRASEVVGIGGNVQQTVAASRFPLDADRRLTRDARHFFVVFENRMGLARPRS